MKITRSFGEYFKYYLHDARVQKIEYVDDLEILVFNNTILDTFTGKRIELPQYQQDYSESEFEVITETYNWGRAVLQGWLWTEGNPVHCIMNIYFTGDMLYVIDESL